jgi:hypothetical protein
VAAIWDDHEVANDFDGTHPSMPRGRTAFREYWPNRAADRTVLHRRLSWGPAADIIILDTRQYRSPNAMPDGPGKTMLGRRQKEWLKDKLRAFDYRVGPARLRDQLAALRPDVLSGAANVLAEVARVRGPGGRDALAPRVIVCAGEVLTPLDRRQISEGLGARVFDLYGSHELGLTAWECPAGSCLHVADDAVILEIVKDGRPAEPGETGEVLGTRLHALAMPFVRDRLGALATPGRHAVPVRGSLLQPGSALAQEGIDSRRRRA